MKRSNRREYGILLEGLSFVVAASEEGGLHVPELSLMLEITQRVIYSRRAGGIVLHSENGLCCSRVTTKGTPRDNL